jgi:GNAT superfamily N-acetyltransferase
MGFGPHFLARQWSDGETEEVIITRDVVRNWKHRAMGDFAVGVCPVSFDVKTRGRLLSGDKTIEARIVEGVEYEKFVLDVGKNFESIRWVGYAGVRDATTTSMPERVEGDPNLPPWEEMIELRYGVAPEVWGKGVARHAAQAVMQWAVGERGVRRFIAETERENERSGKVLQKLGFRLSGTDYWKEPSEVEWERFP